MKKVILIFYNISMTVLAICNSIFLIHNINNWEVDVNETSILLTFLGFFFTFAGIYIYSVFNTNVEIEKKNLRALTNKYGEELANANEGVLSVRKLIYFYQMGQLIVNSPRMNIHIYAWIHQAQSLYKEQTDYMRELYKRGLPIYADYRSDLLSVCRGLSESLSLMIEKVEKSKEQFFDGTQLPRSEQKRLINELKDLNKLLHNDIEVTKNIELQSFVVQKDNSLIQRFKRAWKELKGDS